MHDEEFAGGDGSANLMIKPLPQDPPRIVVVEHWFEELKARARRQIAPMSLAPGSRLGSYDVLSLLGSGGTDI
jgi:hypothetical protein